MAAKQNVAGSITEKKRPATVLQLLGVLICFSYWKGLIFDGAANERIMVWALSGALLIGAIFSGVMSSDGENDNPTTRPYGFAGVFVGFVGLYLVMCYVDNLREKLKLFASQKYKEEILYVGLREKVKLFASQKYKEEILYVGFMIGGSYLGTKIGHIDVAGLLSMFFFTSSVMMYQFETNRLEHFGLIDGLLILQGAMVALNLKDKSSFIQILFSLLMLGTLIFRLYIFPDPEEYILPDADRNKDQVEEAEDREEPDAVRNEDREEEAEADNIIYVICPLLGRNKDREEEAADRVQHHANDKRDGGRLPHLSNGWRRPWLQLLELLLPWSQAEPQRNQAEPQWNCAAESSGTSTFDSCISSTTSTMGSNLRRRNVNGDGGGKSNDSMNAGNGVGGRK